MKPITFIMWLNAQGLSPFLLAMVLCAGVPLASDTTYTETNEPDTMTLEFRTKATSVVAWPFEKVIQPVFELLLSPLGPPLRYVVREDVIDNGIALVTFGEKQNIFLYPSFSMRPGSGSLIGWGYRQRNLIPGISDYIYVGASKYVNGDWDVQSRYMYREILGSPFNWNLRFAYKEDTDNGFIPPGSSESFAFADSSMEIRTGLSMPLPLFSKWRLEYQLGLTRHHFAMPTLQDTLLPRFGDFDRFSRGFYQDYTVIPIGIEISSDTRDAEFAPTTGRNFRVSFHYFHVSDYGGPHFDDLLSNSLNHDFYATAFTWQRYFLVGKKQYSLSREEAKQNQDYFSSFSLQRTMELFRAGKLKETLLDRKVIAVQLRGRQMWEAQDGGAPFTAFGDLGQNTPLRGYSDIPFRDYNTMAASLEYRWPIVKFVDGVVFDEYGLFGRTWTRPELNNLRNSWGFGIRVRKPDMFLARLQAGFHGAQGINLILTIRPEFN